MRRMETALGGIVLLFAVFVAREAMKAPRRAIVDTTKDSVVVDPAPSTRTPSAPVDAPRIAADGHERIDMRFTRPALTPAELDDARRRLRLGAPGTWMADVLAERDSLLLRWRARDAEPLRIWIAPSRRVRGGDPSLDAAVREAFSTWAAAGAPVRVTFVPDSAAADVPVTWREGFPDDRVGVTHVRGLNGELTHGAIELATHTRAGRPLDATWLRPIALHEVGHLLGLPHARSDTASVMQPEAARRGLSRGDRGTVVLLYMLPFGSLRGPVSP